jgi:uncharacterized protein with GYD domain
MSFISRGIRMQRYVVLINFTDKGMKKIKNLPERIQSVRRKIEEDGGKFVDWNLTMGKYDSIAIIELPDDYAVAKLLLGAGKAGYIETTTLKAFPESQLEKIVAKIH